MHESEQWKAKSRLRKRKPKPPQARDTVADCEIGDVVEFADGSRYVVTSWAGGGVFGRRIGEDGHEGDFVSLPGRERIRWLGPRKKPPG